MDTEEPELAAELAGEMDTEEPELAAELGAEMEHGSPDRAGGGAGLQGWKREHAKGIPDLAATGPEVAGAVRSARRRRGTYQATVAVARHLCGSS
jgi:hypothetical protein